MDFLPGLVAPRVGVFICMMLEQLNEKSVFCVSDIETS